MITKHSKTLTILCSILFLTLSACKKDRDIIIEEVPLDLPSTLALTYGEQGSITLSTSLSQRSDATVKFDFSGTEDVQISSGNTLRTKLAEAVTVDAEAGKIKIDTRLLYPNSAISTTTNKKLPDSYNITITASSNDGKVEGKQTIALTIKPAKVQVKGASYSGEQAYAYVLYNEQDASFDLDGGDLTTLAGTSWYLPNPDASTVVSIEGNQIKIAANAGDPEQKDEMVYDIEPTLQKDGFPVASINFKITLIPQIKFFYGDYYPQYGDLTIIYPLIQVGYQNGYRSRTPWVLPETYKSHFSLVSITKNDAAYTDIDKIFSVDSESGAIVIKDGLQFKTGDAYKFTVKAITTVGLEFTTDLTLVLNALED